MSNRQQVGTIPFRPESWGEIFLDYAGLRVRAGWPGMRAAKGKAAKKWRYDDGIDSGSRILVE
ncbi:hypothetical protein ABD76_24235 [Paenibacillus dendritiformis]|nr:hypothetical protein [Paenibacillus dendritiformis]